MKHATIQAVLADSNGLEIAVINAVQLTTQELRLFEEINATQYTEELSFPLSQVKTELKPYDHYATRIHVSTQVNELRKIDVVQQRNRHIDFTEYFALTGAYVVIRTSWFGDKDSKFNTAFFAVRKSDAEKIAVAKYACFMLNN